MFLIIIIYKYITYGYFGQNNKPTLLVKGKQFAIMNRHDST